MFKNKKEQARRWMGYANKNLVGKTIKDVSWMSEKEAPPTDWHTRPVLIEFTDGSMMTTKGSMVPMAVEMKDNKRTHFADGMKELLFFGRASSQEGIGNV